ncbi:bifunctional tetrahydrofolate synthase/dihydrofolate synthase [Saccharobesus litoralis]|uniref:Dihydrofolate synthase/folylpolyglutamate synthase n=1 Tax=Saccharobesus litoralis TaxID=2172099 RepID=A0A2S0VTB3_9ALTE|nr:bifunctional tetrahydrofolate synthase/dihydrofolate synthase [Saccharobesus litoralis]AWB67456.1 bifunctional tetrahydrofolate synthase/dihydrofolate synthase [Saccharobesus litoralis]
MRFNSIAAWLSHLESIHPANIELGLERIKRVYQSLNLNLSNSQVILVGGTNGKGTTCGLLQHVLTHHGYQVGCYNSPHMNDYRERVTLNNQWFSELEHCQAFECVEQARGDISLTYFEMGTLAALVLLAQAQPDFVILEVGLGGRLDATNIVDNDLAIVTTVALDHMDWLGNTREKIGFEKAGIMRHSGLAICGDLEPPQSLLDHANEQKVDLTCALTDYQWQKSNDVWQFTMADKSFSDLPVPHMPLQNAATVLAALNKLNIVLDKKLLQQALSSFSLAGRWQVIARSPDVILDVGHNVQAAEYIKQQLNAYLVNKPQAKVYAVVGILKDKAVEETVQVFADCFAHWYLCSTSGPRGSKAADLQQFLPQGISSSAHDSVVQAYQAARDKASPQDIILVFGSFLVVSDILALENQNSRVIEP